MRLQCGATMASVPERIYGMPRQQIDCPICGTAMQKRIVQDGLELDYCDWHGVWLDSGELERLLATYGAAEASPQAGGRSSGVLIYNRMYRG
jgi:hypothetical protein